MTDLAGVLAAARQQRRLRLAAAALELEPAGGRRGARGRPRRLSTAFAGGDSARALSARRSAWVLDAEAQPGSEALTATAERLAAAWYAAGWRLLASGEICAPTSAVLSSADLAATLVWACSADWTGAGFLALAGGAGGARVAVVNSRQPRELHGGLMWVRATQAAIAAYSPNGADAAPVWIGSRQARWEQLSRAAADAAGWPCIDVLATALPPAAARNDLDGFVPAAVTVTPVWPEDSAAAGRSPRGAADGRLWRDAVVLALSTQALAVAVRAGGNWARQLAAAVAQKNNPERVRVVQVRGESISAGAAALLPAGAGRLAVDIPAEKVVDTRPPAAVGRAVALTPPAQHAGDWPYLTHWTRRPEGGWPDESVAAWLSRVLLEPGSGPPDGLDALARIVVQRRIVGGRQFYREGPAVSFTQWHPAQLLNLPAAARRHRGLQRPLYEPFGIALRCEFLLEAGGAPVIYGDEAVYAELAAEERFRFQWDGPDAAAWSREGEWRLAGDLDFADADPVDFFLIVPDAPAAARLRAAVGPALRIVTLDGGKDRDQ